MNKTRKNKKQIIQHIDSNTINGFQGQYRFLSNFFTSTITYNGKRYKTIEHAYQAAKTLDDKQQDLIRSARTPNEAKQLGRLVSLRPDWDDVKESIMFQLLELKFANVLLQPLLLETENKQLIEENNWNDRYWGCVNGVGKNRLGVLLMKVRDNLRKQIEYEKSKEIETTKNQ